MEHNGNPTVTPENHSSEYDIADPWYSQDQTLYTLSLYIVSKTVIKQRKARCLLLVKCDHYLRTGRMRGVDGANSHHLCVEFCVVYSEHPQW